MIISEVVKFEIHDDWNPYDNNNYKGDIAIAILNKRIEFDAAIQPICIWTYTQSYDDLVGKRGIVAGWGLTEKEELSKVPQYINIPVVGEIDCRNVNAKFSDIISRQSFCAGRDSGQSPCQGMNNEKYCKKHIKIYLFQVTVEVVSL